MQKLRERLGIFGIARVYNDIASARRTERKTRQAGTDIGDLPLDKARIDGVDFVDEPDFDGFRTHPDKIKRIFRDDQPDDRVVEARHEAENFTPMGKFS